MYISLLFLVAILAPIIGITVAIKKRTEPYRACLEGILFAGFGMLLVFVLASAAGSSIAKEIEEAIKMSAEIVAQNDTLFKSLGLEDLNREDRVAAATEIYKYAAEALPAVMLILAAVASYIETMILSSLVKAKGQEVVPLPPIREFSYPRNTIMGWFLIFVLSWIIKGTGVVQGDVLVMNIDLLFQFALSIQGISLLFLVTHLKKVPKAIPVIIVIVLWISGIGRIALFIAGALDLILGLRHRLKG